MNLTSLASMSETQAIASAHKEFAIPAIVIEFIALYLIFALVGFLSTKTSAGKAKFFFILMVSLAFGAVVLALLILSPGLIHQIVSTWS